jgi:cytochrome c oxidase subunit 2
MAAPMLPPPLTEQAVDIDRVWDVFLIGAVSVFAFVVILVLIIVVRFRRRDDRLPRQVRLNLPFELTYTFVPLLIVGALFAITFISVRDVDSKVAADEIDLTVGVVGFRWQWRFEYPEQGVIVSGSSQDIPELVLPASSTVRFEVMSVDVIHSFWIPGFRFKRDLFPDMESTVDVDMTDTTGTWPAGGICAEFCGLDHHKMYFDLRVVTPEEFDQWIAEQGGTP